MFFIPRARHLTVVLCFFSITPIKDYLLAKYSLYIVYYLHNVLPFTRLTEWIYRFPPGRNREQFFSCFIDCYRYRNIPVWHVKYSESPVKPAQTD